MLKLVSLYNLDGKIFTENETHISINNRSFRYGDGFFETIKLINGVIQLKELHFERILQSLQTLGFTLPKHFSFANLENEIIELAIKNKHNQLARIRITFFRKDAELFNVENNEPHILIQSFSLNESVNSINTNGLVVNIYPTAQKSCDVFSNVKTNNYLPYTMAAIWAKQNKLNDALVLNSYNNIADSCIANVFIIKNGIIKTPALTQGCINGVMRKHIITKLQQKNITVLETIINIEEIENADEIFLTNAIKGMMWVKQCGNNYYKNLETQKIATYISI